MNSYNSIKKRLCHRGQIDIIDMPVQLNCNYKYFFVYEDQVSRFVVLKGLQNNTANEVAIKLLDILAIIGPPQVLQSSNGRKFAQEVVQEIRLLWKDFAILHGEICESERTRDFKNLLECWIEKNPTTTWYEALKHIQIFQNSTFRSENGRIPYDVLFGRNVHEEFQRQTNKVDLRQNIWTEEEWISLVSNNKSSVEKENSQQLIEDSVFTGLREMDHSKEYESDSCSEARTELQKSIPGFNFVNVKSETLNLDTEDLIFEDESLIDDKIIKSETLNMHTEDLVFENDSVIDDKIVKSETLNMHTEDLVFEDGSVIDDKICSVGNRTDLKCKICQKQYMKLGHLKNHMKIHVKGNKFKCKLCKKTFHVLILYQKHMRQSHGQNKLSPSSKKRRSKDLQDEIRIDIKASKFSFSSGLNLNDTQSNVQESYPKTKRGFSLLKEKKKIAADNRLMEVNGDSTLKCPYCHQKFNFPSVLKRHMRSHTNERPYVCEICKKSFKQLGHLSQHSLTHKDCRSFHCTVCGVKFDSLSGLKVHAQSHKDDYISKTQDIFRLFECDICKKVFTTKSVLERHILTHSQERQFACVICGKRFKQAGHVKSHMLVHTGERKFECTVCKKRFSLSNSLKKHMYVHNGEKPYQCDLCGARFLEKRNLNGHIMTHTNERPFRCKICGKRYTLADTLRRHVSAAHEDGRTYQCEICAKMFKQLAHLSVHKKVHNDERPFQCHLCEKNFKHKNVLKSHLAIHANVRPFECDECKATFVRKTNLQTHIASAHMNERPYVCIICGKRFKQISHLNGHAIVHSNLMPYQCDFCDRRCNRLDNLKKHMRLHTKNKD